MLTTIYEIVCVLAWPTVIITAIVLLRPRRPRSHN
jgi:hypothetical protein